jgi:cytochrome P450
MTAPTLAVPFNPLAPEQQENPFDILAAARREQPVFYVPALKLWVVTRYDDVLAVLKDHETFSSTGALKSDSTPVPKEVAAILAEGFSRDALHYRSRSTAARSYPRPRDQGFHAAADRFA